MAPASDATKREVSLAGKQPKELVHDRGAKMCTASQRKKTGYSLHVHQEETWLHKSQHRHSYSCIRTKDEEP